MKRLKIITITNTLGLAFGFTALLLIGRYIVHEIGHERSHNNVNKIFLVTENIYVNKSSLEGQGTPFSLAPFIQKKLPQLSIARAISRQSIIHLPNDSIKNIDKFIFADPEILNILTFKITAAYPYAQSHEPGTMLLAASLARQYFGSDNNALGKEIRIENKLSLRITGVFEDFTDETHFRPHMIAHVQHYIDLMSEPVQQFVLNDWIFNPAITYIQLDEGINRSRVQHALDSMLINRSGERSVKSVHYKLKPLSELYLYTAPSGVGMVKPVVYVYVFFSIALLVLFMAVINFINLFLADTMDRVREMSIRKMVGLNNRAIYKSLFNRSIRWVLLAGAIAYLLTLFLLPQWAMITGKEMSTGWLTSPAFLGSWLIFLIIIAIVTTSLPGLLIRQIEPASGLHIQIKWIQISIPWIIRSQVIGQFIITAGLVVFMLTVDHQIKFLKDQNLGFSKDNVITLSITPQHVNNLLETPDSSLMNRIMQFKERVLKISDIEAVTSSAALPGDAAVLGEVQTERLPKTERTFAAVLGVDEDYLDTYGIKLVRGVDINQDSLELGQSYLINEQAVKLLNFEDPSEAIGETITVMKVKGRIVGVIQDFHAEGLLVQPRPLILNHDRATITNFSIRLNQSAEVSKCLAQIKAVWQNTFPGRAFEPQHLDAYLENELDGQRHLASIAQFLCISAAIIASFGLFGMSAFVFRMQVKEIVLRRISGATPWQMLLLLLKRNYRLLVQAVLIGFPIGFWLGKFWLMRFPVQVALTWTDLMLLVCVLAGVMLPTLLYFLLYTVTVNPVAALRNE